MSNVIRVLPCLFATAVGVAPPAVLPTVVSQVWSPPLRSSQGAPWISGPKAVDTIGSFTAVHTPNLRGQLSGHAALKSAGVESPEALSSGSLAITAGNSHLNVQGFQRLQNAEKSAGTWMTFASLSLVALAAAAAGLRWWQRTYAESAVVTPARALERLNMTQMSLMAATRPAEPASTAAHSPARSDEFAVAAFASESVDPERRSEAMALPSCIKAHSQRGELPDVERQLMAHGAVVLAQGDRSSATCALANGNRSCPPVTTFPRRVVSRGAASPQAEVATVVKPTFDYTFWAENTAAVQANADNRKFKCDVAEVVRMNDSWRGLRFKLQELQKARNAHSKRMKGKMEAEERQKLIDEGKKIKDECNKLEQDLEISQSKMEEAAALIPNMSHPDTPIGEEENAVVVRTQGKPRSSEDAGFELRDHLEIGKILDLFDFDSGGKVSGQKFVYFKNGAALLELALVQWAMHQAVKRGFLPQMTPDLVRSSVVAGCGFMPRDGEATQIYSINDSDLCLAGTAEIPSAGMFMNETLIATKELPQRLACFGHAFRTEAGSSGSENRGIYRLHQFSKVELFAVTRGTTEESDRMLEEIRQLEEDMFTELGLCFRVLDMPTEELGAPAYRKYDMEAWMPGMQKWGEISSCSNCTDYQARLLNIRFKEEYNLKGSEFVHTLNGTACAVPRMIISILETFQNEDGSVTIPEVLRPYMMGIDVLKVPEGYS